MSISEASWLASKTKSTTRTRSTSVDAYLESMNVKQLLAVFVGWEQHGSLVWTSMSLDNVFGEGDNELVDEKSR